MSVAMLDSFNWPKETNFNVVSLQIITPNSDPSRASNVIKA